VLWELLTLHRPFPDSGLEGGWQEVLARLTAQRRAGPAANHLQETACGPAPGLDRVLLACLSPDVGDRPASAAELARQLETCLQPRTLKLVHAPPHGWRRRARGWPILAVLLAATMPNALAAVFNVYYNRQEIIDHLSSIDPLAPAVFWTVQGTINAIAFPLGMALVAWFAWPIRQGLRASQLRPTPPAERLLHARQRCLTLGHLVAGLGILEWVGALSPTIYVHFLASLALCGLIAAAYPFFAIAFLGVNAWYPAFVATGAAVAGEAQRLERLRRLTWIYLLVAACVPMLAVTLLVLIGSGNRLALLLLGVGGLAGFGLVFGLMRLIHGDLDALAFATRPSNDAAGESFESSWDKP
jgi:hypothetical protein